MTKKTVLRITAFLLIFAMVLLLLNDMFEQENVSYPSKRFYTYRTFEKDTIDVVFFGTSGIDRYWITSQGYEDYGFTSYPLSTDGCPAWLYPYVIDEALSKQDPGLIIVDIRPFTLNAHERKMTELDTMSRAFLDVLPALSPNRAKAAFKTMEVLHEINLKKVQAGEDTTEKEYPRFNLSYLFSFIRYHQMWEEDNYRLFAHLGYNPHLFGGFFVSEGTVLTIEEQKPAYNTDTAADLDPLCEQALYDLIDFLKKKDLNVLFLDTPQCHTKAESKRANTVYKILEQENMDYLHYYDTDSETGFSIDLDLKTDFYDDGHVNFYGATKFTKVFSKYLKDNYDLPDHRQDEKIADRWDGVQSDLIGLLGSIRDKKKEQYAKKIDASVSEQEKIDRLAIEIKQAEKILK